MSRIKYQVSITFILMQLLQLHFVTASYYEGRSYDMYCLQYDSTNTDLCTQCNSYGGTLTAGILYTGWGQDCQTDASDGSCAEYLSQATQQDPQQPGESSENDTFCLTDGISWIGSVGTAGSSNIYLACEYGCEQCYDITTGYTSYPASYEFKCWTCQTDLAKVITSTTTTTTTNTAHGQGPGTSSSSTTSYIGYECTRQCQAHPSAKYLNSSVIDTLSLNSSSGAAANPGGLSQTISVCMACDANNIIGLCAPNSSTLSLNSYECNYTYPRFPTSFSSSSTYKGFSGNLSTSDCTGSRNSQLLTLEFYVDTVYNPACANSGCDGSASNPYDDIYYVAQQLAYNSSNRITDYLESNVTIYLNAGTHYWMDTNTEGANSHGYNMQGKYELLRLFERAHANITIKPTSCQNYQEGQCPPEKTVTVKLKSHYLSIFVSNYLSIENIVFDASDLSYPINSTCWYNRTDCCTYDSNLGVYTPTSAAKVANADYLCDEISLDSSMSSNNAPGASVEYDPSYTVTQPLGFINTKFLKDYSKAKYPRVSIYNTMVLNFYNYNDYSNYLSFIHVDFLSGHIILSNVNVNNYFFPRGFISNFGNEYEDPTKERIYTCKDASTTSENTTDCYSLNITNSSFSYYNKQLYSAIYGQEYNEKIAASTASSSSNSSNSTNGSTTTASNAWQQVTILQEGAVINLQSFDGYIWIQNTTFQNSVSAAHDVSLKNISDPDYIYKHNCYQYYTQNNGDLSNLDYNNASSIKIHLDRHMRKFWVEDTTRSGSLINLRYLSKGLFLYNNTFDGNIGHTGSALFINEFRNTKTYPIIIYNNIFKNNFAYLFGLSIVLFKNGSSYIQNECYGISVTNNQFVNNMGCSNAFGNVMIVCDCSALPTSSNTGQESYDSEDFWAVSSTSYKPTSKTGLI